MSLLDDDFDVFWANYPKKVAKAEARKAWARLKPTEPLVHEIIGALAWQRRRDDWIRDGGKFIPHPATWLRGARWEDEPTETPRVSERTIATARAVQEFLND